MNLWTVERATGSIHFVYILLLYKLSVCLTTLFSLIDFALSSALIVILVRSLRQERKSSSFTSLLIPRSKLARAIINLGSSFCDIWSSENFIPNRATDRVPVEEASECGR